MPKPPKRGLPIMDVWGFSPLTEKSTLALASNEASVSYEVL